MGMVKDSINLMPRGRKRSLALPVNAWSAAAAVFVLVWIVLFGIALNQRAGLQKNLVLLEPQKRALREQLTALQRELGLTAAQEMGSEKASVIKSLLNDRVVWSEVFKHFSRIVPQGLWFDSLEGSSGGTAEVKIRGGVVTYEALSQFMTAMERSQYFMKPQLNFAQKTVVRGRDVVSFEIVCGIKKGQGAP